MLDLIFLGQGTSTSVVSPFDKFCRICFKVNPYFYWSIYARHQISMQSNDSNV